MNLVNSSLATPHWRTPSHRGTLLSSRHAQMTLYQPSRERTVAECVIRIQGIASHANHMAQIRVLEVYSPLDTVPILTFSPCHSAQLAAYLTLCPRVLLTALPAGIDLAPSFNDPEPYQQETLVAIENVWSNSDFAAATFDAIHSMGHLLIPRLDVFVREHRPVVDSGTSRALVSFRQCPPPPVLLFRITSTLLLAAHLHIARAPPRSYVWEWCPPFAVSCTDLGLWLARCIVQTFAFWTVEGDPDRYTRAEIVMFSAATFSILSNYTAANHRIAPVCRLAYNPSVCSGMV